MQLPRLVSLPDTPEYHPSRLRLGSALEEQLLRQIPLLKRLRRSKERASLEELGDMVNGCKPIRVLRMITVSALVLSAPVGFAFAFIGYRLAKSFIPGFAAAGLLMLTYLVSFAAMSVWPCPVIAFTWPLTELFADSEEAALRSCANPALE